MGTQLAKCGCKCEKNQGEEEVDLPQKNQDPFLNSENNQFDDDLIPQENKIYTNTFKKNEKILQPLDHSLKEDDNLSEINEDFLDKGENRGTAHYFSDEIDENHNDHLSNEVISDDVCNEIEKDFDNIQMKNLRQNLAVAQEISPIEEHRDIDHFQSLHQKKEKTLKHNSHHEPESQTSIIHKPHQLNHINEDPKPEEDKLFYHHQDFKKLQKLLPNQYYQNTSWESFETPVKEFLSTYQLTTKQTTKINESQLKKEIPKMSLANSLLNDVIFFSELKKLHLNASNVRDKKYIKRFCAITNEEFKCFHSKENFITLQKPVNIYKLRDIKKVNFIQFNKDVSFMKNESRVRSENNKKLFNFLIWVSGPTDSFEIFASEREEIVNKWICIFNFFCEKQKQN